MPFNATELQHIPIDGLDARIARAAKLLGKALAAIDKSDPALAKIYSDALANATDVARQGKAT